jgi:hypothetical protein
MHTGRCPPRSARASRSSRRCGIGRDGNANFHRGVVLTRAQIRAEGTVRAARKACGRRVCMVQRWGTVRSAHDGCVEAPDGRWGTATSTPFAKRRSSRMDVSDEGRAPRTRRSRSPFPWIEIDCGRDGASRRSSSAASGEAAARGRRSEVAAAAASGEAAARWERSGATLWGGARGRAADRSEGQCIERRGRVDRSEGCG